MIEEPETNISPDFCTVILTCAAGFCSNKHNLSDVTGNGHRQREIACEIRDICGVFLRVHYSNYGH